MSQPSFDQYAAALRELEQKHGHILIPMDFGLLLAVIGACQLALRHPDFPSYSHGLLTRWIWEVAHNIPNDIVQRHILDGFNPEHDQ